MKNKLLINVATLALLLGPITACNNSTSSTVANAKTVKSIKKPLYYYVNNTNSLTKKESPKRFNEHLCAYAVVRALCDSSEDIRYRKAFINRMWRIKASLWFDGHDSRHVLGHGGLKELRLNKSTIKMLKSKEKLDVDSLPMKDFIHECLSPFE